MFVHVFGAYFGLMVSRVINDNAIYQSPARNKTGSHYHSDIFAMIGMYSSKRISHIFNITLTIFGA